MESVKWVHTPDGTIWVDFILMPLGKVWIHFSLCMDKISENFFTLVIKGNLSGTGIEISLKTKSHDSTRNMDSGIWLILTRRKITSSLSLSLYIYIYIYNSNKYHWINNSLLGFCLLTGSMCWRVIWSDNVNLTSLLCCWDHLHWRVCFVQLIGNGITTKVQILDKVVLPFRKAWCEGSFVVL